MQGWPSGWPVQGNMCGIWIAPSLISGGVIHFLRGHRSFHSLTSALPPPISSRGFHHKRLGKVQSGPTFNHLTLYSALWTDASQKEGLILKLKLNICVSAYQGGDTLWRGEDVAIKYCALYIVTEFILCSLSMGQITPPHQSNEWAMGSMWYSLNKKENVCFWGLIQIQ